MNLEANDARYLSLTPAGCFHAVQSPKRTDERRLLLHLLSRPASTTVEVIAADDESFMPQLAQLARAGFLHSGEKPETLPETNLSDLLPTLLPALSQRGRVVLTESRQGLFLDYCGVTRDQAEELAVLASSLRAIADQRSTLLSGQLAVHSRAFGIVDPAGNSEIGFWPLHIGDNVFTLTILGIPRFNIEAFRLLVWVLVERYGKTGTVHTL